MLARRDDSFLVIVDMQPTFLAPIHRSAEVLRRVRFLAEAARLLDVPVLYSEQYPERMGGTDEGLAAVIDKDAFAKKAFSCMGSEGFVSAAVGLGRRQAILCGIETHICVNQTAHHLVDDDFQVILAADAASARTAEMDRIGEARMRDLGCAIAHSESVLYEWMQTADHPAFKEALELVKAYPAG